MNGRMTDDLNLHVEAIRALFKKRFSGGIEGFPDLTIDKINKL